MSNRWDETWHRLREWTNGQTPSERLAAQILLADGFTEIDPSHPLGGRDGGKDATCTHRNGEPWIMAVYFPRGQKTFKEVENKLLGDFAGVKAASAVGMAFVTNQELTLAERESLRQSAKGSLDLYHLERIVAMLDDPRMRRVRRQFLGMEDEEFQIFLRRVEELRPIVTRISRKLRDRPRMEGPGMPHVPAEWFEQSGDDIEDLREFAYHDLRQDPKLQQRVTKLVLCWQTAHHMSTPLRFKDDVAEALPYWRRQRWSINDAWVWAELARERMAAIRTDTDLIGEPLDETDEPIGLWDDGKYEQPGDPKPGDWRRTMS